MRVRGSEVSLKEAGSGVIVIGAIGIGCRPVIYSSGTFSQSSGRTISFSPPDSRSLKWK